jgi:hypothetical protein
MDDLDLGATIKGFSPGQKLFGRYTLKAQLGRGGMGVVWRARDESLERDVAIKMLPEVVANDPSAVRDLKRETAKSQQLSHPHILRIYDFVEAGPLCGITMELVEGGTLTAKRLEQPGEVFTVAALQTWVGQLCEALEYAHSREKIVHRDLKPANLMLTADGQLKVADFGIAASVSDSVSRVSQQAGSSGTPVYMSPQQMMGEKPAVSDDIYALGATLYELLTGKPPFYSGNIIMQVQNKVPPTVTERRAELGVTGDPIPPAWEAAIAACLAKEPQDRPQSAGEVLERLGLTAKNTYAFAKATADTKPDAKVERVVPQPLKAQATDGSGTSRATSKTPLFAGIFAGIVLLGGLGWYFGVHAPEQQRLEQVRVESERVSAEKARLAEAERLEQMRLANARGGLVVRTVPAGAEVRVGALALGKSPLSLPDQRLGGYTVQVRLEGYEDWDGTTVIEEGKFTEMNVQLVRSLGRLTVAQGPVGFPAESAEIVSQGVEQWKRTVQVPGELELPTGIYDVVFRRTGWPDFVRRVEIGRNAGSSVAAEFVPGSVTIQSNPSGAEVLLGGRHVGLTPLTLHDLAPGNYAVQMRRYGHGMLGFGITIKAGDTLQVAENLKKDLDFLRKEYDEAKRAFMGNFVTRRTIAPEDKRYAQTEMIETIAFGSDPKAMTVVHGAEYDIWFKGRRQPGFRHTYRYTINLHQAWVSALKHPYEPQFRWHGASANQGITILLPESVTVQESWFSLQLVNATQPSSPQFLKGSNPGEETPKQSSYQRNGFDFPVRDAAVAVREFERFKRAAAELDRP